VLVGIELVGDHSRRFARHRAGPRETQLATIDDRRRLQLASGAGICRNGSLARPRQQHDEE
jgi:hypothetical protein